MKVKDLFDIKYGVNLELSNLEVAKPNEDGVNFVSRTSKNNGVVARVKLIEGVEPSFAGTISCAGGGSVLSTFVQQEPYYSGRDLYCLTPHLEMSLNERFYYAHLIHENKYKYNFGRQANKTLGDIELPNTLPEWLATFDIAKYKRLIGTNNKSGYAAINTSEWRSFQMDEIFSFSKGKRLTQDDMLEGKLNYIGAISDNNGIRQLIEASPTHKGNCITVNYNGSVGEAFYQKDDFWASDDVNVLTLKGRLLNVNLALFLCSIIKANKFRFGYGRKWTLEKMKGTNLLLPVNKKKEPDWAFMETYIKQLPYADRI